MPLNERQLEILSHIIEEYVATAQPVASKTIVNKYDIHVSPATVRNDMAALESAGYLRQPHTSSGRIPTEEGYRYYLQNIAERKKQIRPGAPMRQVAEQSQSPKDLVREMAKLLVKLSGETAFMSLDDGWNYYTGISKLFEKPEFNDVNTLRSLSSVVDHFDEYLDEMFELMDRDVNVWIGGENPLSQKMATVIVRYQMKNGMSGVIGLTGPMRMNYSKNIKLLSEAKKLMGEL